MRCFELDCYNKQAGANSDANRSQVNFQWGLAVAPGANASDLQILVRMCMAGNKLY